MRAVGLQVAGGAKLGDVLCRPGAFQAATPGLRGCGWDHLRIQGPIGGWAGWAAQCAVLTLLCRRRPGLRCWVLRRDGERKVDVLLNLVDLIMDYKGYKKRDCATRRACSLRHFLHVASLSIAQLYRVVRTCGRSMYGKSIQPVQLISESGRKRVRTCGTCQTGGRHSRSSCR